MANIKDVIKGLECAIDPDHGGFKGCHSCEYRKDVDHLQWVCDGDRCIADALELLKAQEEEIEMLKQEIEGHIEDLQETLNVVTEQGRKLKAQEPVEPVFERTFMSDIEIYDCGKCGTSLGAKGIAKYCMKCGQAVKWE